MPRRLIAEVTAGAEGGPYWSQAVQIELISDPAFRCYFTEKNQNATGPRKISLVGQLALSFDPETQEGTWTDAVALSTGNLTNKDQVAIKYPVASQIPATGWARFGLVIDKMPNACEAAAELWADRLTFETGTNLPPEHSVPDSKTDSAIDLNTPGR